MGIWEASMLTAFIIIAIILLSGGARQYFKHKYSPQEHIDALQSALARNAKGKQRLHNVQK